MTPRIVIMATLHDPRNGAWHAVDPITGGPRCGVPLRLPHRAIAVTDGPWCRSCWDVETVANPVAQTPETTAISGRIGSGAEGSYLLDADPNTGTSREGLA